MPRGQDCTVKVCDPFYRKADWVSLFLTFVISLTVYVCTLAPSVTLEDSGELVVAADYLGVPHPPGYPIWTLLAWLFQRLFHFVTYHGHPNPAWSVGLMSSVFGALAAGLLAMLVSRSGHDLLHSTDPAHDKLSQKAKTYLAWMGGVTGGLLFAFSPVLWSQSVIVEVYSLNAFFLTLILVLTYRWMARPHESYLLYITAFVFGLGFTNHQSLLFAGLGLAAAMACRDLRLFRDCTAIVFAVLGILFVGMAMTLTGGGSLEALQELAEKRALFNTAAVVLLGTTIGLFMIERKVMTEYRRVLPLLGSGLIGLSFYSYLPVASLQNPPMNWGYTKTMDGFKHHVGRQQYEKISVVENLKEFFADPGAGFDLFYTVIFSPTDFVSVVWQFTWPMAVFVGIAFAMVWKSGWRLVSWFLVSTAFFISLSFIFLLFQWPDPDVQNLFVGRVQYIQCHAIYAMWIGYGVVLGGLLLNDLAKRVAPRLELAYGIGLLFALGLPFALVHRNFNSEDPQYRKYVGGVEQNGHNFGWQFGHYQLRGAQAILEELEDGETPLPNSDYPSEMDQNAIFFGGTDPGRFVPTYMIYSAKVREDVYLITQNALADSTYTNVMRDLYGDDIWIPAVTDCNAAFREYWQGIQAGYDRTGANVSVQGGKISVEGVGGVMKINATLARNIFDKNKHKHSFYLEESYPIPWMYPHLVPHGLIMKINASPLAGLTDEMIRNDMEFWAWYSQRLLNDPKFLRDVVARKTFSKLRSSIAGLYIYRKLFKEAEVAFLEAIDLYDLSPEANFRLAAIYQQRRQYASAKELLTEFLAKDTENIQVADYLKQVTLTHQKDVKREALEHELAHGADVHKALELLTLYVDLNMMNRFQRLVGQILAVDEVPAPVYRNLAALCNSARHPDLAAKALGTYLRRNSTDSKAWLELAAIQLSAKRADSALQCLEKAISVGGSNVIKSLRTDSRFFALRTTPRFRKLVPQSQPTSLKF